MTKRQKGFSLAEVLITLLIVGVVGAAAIPTMTKRQTGTDKMWDWADYPVGSAYSVGTHVLLDSAQNGNQVPESLNYFSDNEGLDATVTNYLANEVQPALDKLLLFNDNRDEDGNLLNVHSLAVPHISMYNQYRVGLNKVTDYTGSLKSDKRNLALGIGSLQRLIPEATTGRFNTAIGHYTLLSDEGGSYNTALGSMALVSAGYGQDGSSGNKALYNVAVGSQALKNNISGDLNTAVGYQAMTGVESGIRNIAVGTQALYVDDISTGAFGNDNIAIGYRAGYNSTSSGANNNLFIGESGSELASLIQAGMGSDKKTANSFFNINADELIVNTADGTHTILKIRMKDDSTVTLPELTPSGYKKLNYCRGEGSEDIKKANNDPAALADVCIAKFSNLKAVGYKEYSPPMKTPESTFLGIINKALKKTSYDYEYLLHTPDTQEYSDWDIFIKRLNVGASGPTSTGLNDPVFIQTVKASLNYLDAWKEGMGLVSIAIRAFTNNFLCFFSFLGADCDSAGPDKPYTLSDWISQRIEKLKEDIKALFSDRRLKNISGESTAGLKEINALKIKNYTFKSDKAQTPHVGVIAQELQKVFPNSVIEGSDGYLRIKKEEMFFAMVNAIKELDKKDKELRAEIPMVNKQIKDAVDQNKKLLTKNELLKIENEKLQAQLKEIEAQQ